MARTFSVDTRVAPTSLLARVRKAARENGAILVGDERSGRFSHELVKGEYRVVGQTVMVTITGQALAAALARGGGPLEGTR
jgi:hypothetical protein